MVEWRLVLELEQVKEWRLVHVLELEQVKEWWVVLEL